MNDCIICGATEEAPPGVTVSEHAAASASAMLGAIERFGLQEIKSGLCSYHRAQYEWAKDRLHDEERKELS